jgi:cytochrome oxidase Cu insertion factor (SCO1/SenC/PrrC family)
MLFVAIVAATVIFVLRGATHSTVAQTAASGVTPPPAAWPAATRRAPGFSLVDQTGRRVSLTAYRGRPVIVTFIDPLCRNFCPLEAKQLNLLVHRMPATSRPEILAVSVNIYGNARRNLVQDVAKWRLTPQWRWAVGAPAQLARVWRRYQIGVLATTKTIAGVTVHEITHTEAAYVIDKSGYERALFLWPFQARDVSAVLSSLGTSSPS